MRQLLNSLANDDPEHPDVSLNHESGWSLSVFSGGLIIFENVETGEGPWHMRASQTDTILKLWRALAASDLQHLLSQPWAAGYGTG